MQGWMSTSWNQDFQEKYQQPQIQRWYHSNGKKWRGTKEHLDEGERGEWKIWLKNSTFKKLRLWHLVPSPDDKKMGKQWKQWQILFSWAPKLLRMVTATTKFRHFLLGRKAIANLDSILNSRDITLPTKVCIVKSIVFPVSHVRVWELDHK